MSFDRFNICQAYAQLESDYNVGGWLRERPSNQRRRESIGCQLARIGFSNPYGWVEIEAESDPEMDGPDEEEARVVYMTKVLEWGLPIDADLMRAIKRFFVSDYVARFPQCAGDEYQQNGERA